MSEAEAKDHPDVIMLPPLIVLIVLAVAIVLEWLLPLAFLPPLSWTAWSLYAGVFLAADSVALVVWAFRAFVAVGTNASPHLPTVKLSSDGPYRFTRNPMYLGLILMLAAVSLIFSLEWGLIFTPALALILHYGVVLREEQYLTAKFGDSYRALLGRTRRWL